jgi:hypothetical protein
MAPEDVKAVEERMEAEFLVPFDQVDYLLFPYTSG